jgi:hypothetical protein
MRVRLTRKLAETIDGIDLTRSRVGDLIDLSQHDAEVLVAEGWATSADALFFETTGCRLCDDPATQLSRTLGQLRRVWELMEQRTFGQQEHRRAEDRIREELQDSRAKTIRPQGETSPDRLATTPVPEP